MTEFYYYIKRKKLICSSCGLYHIEDNPYIFIGESVPYTNFSLLTHNNIPNLKAWKARWEVPGTLIVNGGGEEVSPIDMLTIITMRKFDGQLNYTSNYELGFHGLLRAHVGSMFIFGDGNGYGQCIKNEDTYDLYKTFL